MKLNIGSGQVNSESDIEAFNLYDEASIELARHGVMSKALRQARGKGGFDDRSRRNKSRGGRDGRHHPGRHDGR